MSGSSAIVVNNQIPVDPVLGGAIRVVKTTSAVNVVVGDLVPFTITVTNTLSVPLTNINVVDQIPAGFKFRSGSAFLNGVNTPPTVSGITLSWPNLTFAASEQKTFKLLLVVGSGVGQGKYTNQAWALNNIVNTIISNIGTATVRVVPDPTFDCADIIGKVFDDKNANGYQDEGEPGIANVRLVTANGLILTTDAQGRFHLPCAAIPNEDIGSNFILKLDERTLPTGYRMTTENPLVVRLTDGKMSKMNFGASISRVVRIDVSDGAFEPHSTKLTEEFLNEVISLDQTLQERPSIVRIAYRIKGEPRDLVDQRIKILHDMIQKRWEKGKSRTPLVFEEETVEIR
jgi:uncharacterized repeat protein (TIGR01451 family)